MFQNFLADRALTRDHQRIFERMDERPPGLGDQFEDFSDCVSSNSCAAAGEECLGNAFSLLAACPELLEDSIGGDDCCGSTDTCDWANDGFCDCDGEQAWDVADCGS
jgi:hypothetical protein